MRRCTVRSGFLGPLVVVSSLVIASGCAGAGSGGELSVRPQPRAVSAAEGTTVRFPADGALNITLLSASKEPGLSGAAETDTDIDAQGSAAASASVTNGGQASAQFQLGQSLQNDTTRQTDFDLTVRFSYEFDAAAEPASRLPAGTVSLRLFARRPVGRPLRELTFVEHATELGNIERAATEEARCTVTLGPGETLHVFLAGVVSIDVPDGRSAAGRVSVKDVTIEAETSPAPAVKAAADEQR
jgi:hypothetical protein